MPPPPSSSSAVAAAVGLTGEESEGSAGEDEVDAGAVERGQRGEGVGFGEVEVGVEMALELVQVRGDFRGGAHDGFRDYRVIAAGVGHFSGDQRRGRRRGRRGKFVGLELGFPGLGLVVSRFG